MFGTIDLPPGGQLPPAPTYLRVNGEEESATWILLYETSSGDSVYYAALLDWDNDLCVMRPGAFDITVMPSLRNPWNHR